MGIFDALTTSVTGLQAQSYALQNISGNIANSQTTAFKRIDSSFEDLIPSSTAASKQLSGSVQSNSRSTNTVQGDIQTSSISTFMAINGSGFFVVQKPSSQTDGKPVFAGVDLYSRRGDFQVDKSGYLVNGAGYYLLGIPVDKTTGNLTGSVPQLLQFQNDFLPAQQTSEIDYRANLSSTPKTTKYDSSIPGSDLLKAADFQANPLAIPSQVATITGVGASLTPDNFATVTGGNDISSYAVPNGTTSLVLNGQTITFAAADNANAIKTKINAVTVSTGVTASIDANNKLVLKSADADTGVNIQNGSDLTLLSALGVTIGNNDPTNLLTQHAVSQGQTLVVKFGANAATTLTFGTGAGEISTLGELSSALTSQLTGGTGSVNTANGNITLAAGSINDPIAISGTATPATFGMQTVAAVASNQTVIGNDLTAFLAESVGGGAITTYDVSGSPVNVQVRWAKVDSASQGTGHSDTWNMFYQTNTTATGTQAAWKNVGTNFSFGPNGQMVPAITNLTIPNATVDGVTLGDVAVKFGTGGLTQFADSNGVAQVNQLSQNGFAAGSLQTVSVNDKGRIVGAYSNGRTIDLAEITLANFNGANFLKRIDGGAFETTSESGTAVFGGASGQIVGSSLEGSNTDIADEFTKLIVTQQAYSANTRVITTGNQMVQDLLNMLR